MGDNGEYIEPAPSRSRTYVKGSASKFINGEIVCDVCGEGFKCNTMAIQHKFRKHPESATKHFCPQCGMQFPLKVSKVFYFSFVLTKSRLVSGKIFSV